MLGCAQCTTGYCYCSTNHLDTPKAKRSEIISTYIQYKRCYVALIHLEHVSAQGRVSTNCFAVYESYDGLVYIQETENKNKNKTPIYSKRRLIIRNEEHVTGCHQIRLFLFWLEIFKTLDSSQFWNYYK